MSLCNPLSKTKFTLLICTQGCYLMSDILHDHLFTLSHFRIMIKGALVPCCSLCPSLSLLSSVFKKVKLQNPAWKKVCLILGSVRNALSYGYNRCPILSIFHLHPGSGQGVIWPCAQFGLNSELFSAKCICGVLKEGFRAPALVIFPPNVF